MNKLQKIIFMAQVVKGGAKEQLKQQWVFGAAVAIGLSQGLKYNGSVKRGVNCGLATIITIAAANGFSELMNNWDKIKEL